MALEGTVNTPFGAAKKKNVVLAGGALIGILGIAWYRSKQSQAASTATDTSQLDQATADGLSADQGYSSSDYSGLSYDQYGNPIYTGGPGAGFLPGPGPVPGPGTFTSNAQWAQYVEQYLEQQQGADPSVVGNAIGKYITAQPVTPEQVQVIDSAIAIGGYPPVAGAGGNPPGIVNAPPSGGGGGGGGGTQAHNPVSGLHPTNVGATQVTVAWNKSQGAKSYLVTTSTGGKVVNRKTVSTINATVHGLKSTTQYTIKVHAGPSNNPQVAQTSVRTKGLMTSRSK